MNKSIVLTIISLLGIQISIAYSIDISQISDKFIGISGIASDEGIIENIIDGSDIIWSPINGEKCIGIQKKIIDDTTIIIISIQGNGISYYKYAIKKGNDIFKIITYDELINIIKGISINQQEIGSIISSIPYRKIIISSTTIGDDIINSTIGSDDHNGQPKGAQRTSMDDHDDPIEAKKGASEQDEATKDEKDEKPRKESPQDAKDVEKNEIGGDIGDIPLEIPKQRPISSSIVLDITSIRPRYTTMHEGHLGQVIQRTFIPESGYSFTKIMDGQETIWTASGDIGATSAYIYIKNDILKIMNIYIKDESPQYFIKYNGGWINTTKQECDKQYQDLIRDISPDDSIIDITALPEKGIVIKKQSESIIEIKPLNGIIIRKIVDGSLDRSATIWSSPDGRCISTSIIFIQEKPQLIQIIAYEDGKCRNIYLEKGIAWTRITKKDYDNKLEKANIKQKEDGFIIPSIITIITIISLFIIHY